ncbi:MAG: aryl-alcohol dehydrogenase-like predicted oxidoreductase [Phycisphaerales bacterium]|jgi:aryl-alcohol dehydrogenase-like predicted oxidoreductase
MDHTRLGKTGLKVSPLCLGTMNFGWGTTEPDSHAIMDEALNLGINFFDTADMYGWEVERGHTEKIIGRWWAGDAQKRDRVVLATKVYHAMPDKHPEPNRGTTGLSAMKIIRHCEDSLKRLQTDRIDLYQMHHSDPECPWDEIFEAFETLKRQGKVVYAGSSNFAGWQIATANSEAKRLGQVGLVSEQSLYNLDARTIEMEVIPACRHSGMGLIPWSPLAGGMLGGVLAKIDSGRRTTDNMLKKIESKRPQLEAWENFCKELGEHPADVALAWLLANPVVTAPIIGPSRMDQLTGSIHATEITLSTETMAKLDEIFPGPGGEAPMAYAW